MYYAYSDNQNGFGEWKNHTGAPFSLPLFDADFIKVMEPGDYVQTIQQNQVWIVSGFDWNITANGDVHIISTVRDLEINETKHLHTYKPDGSSSFITSEDFGGGSAIYTSGDSVFLIGLKNGRVFIQKAKGGTNDFETVYQAISGKTFNHGRVHISEGRLHCYLLERGSGSARPLYLQIIDLDIDENSNETSTVSFSRPTGDTVLEEGYSSFVLTAEALDKDGTITNMALYINDVLIRNDVLPPYEWGIGENINETLGLEPGNHTFRAVASTYAFLFIGQS